MRYGIPNYRPPRDVLDAEVQRIAALGVPLKCGHRVDDLAAERAAGRFDAVFVRLALIVGFGTMVPSMRVCCWGDCVTE
jgi:NADPH-dependent glutamate synthase beta subunit-like oxidoreductase